MARKRMFRLDVLETDAFMDMPLTTQALYFHLNMRADDDGFIGNPKQIVRLIGASQDDLKLLIAKKFVLTFEDGVIVIKHWRMHNTLSANRYKETNFLEDKAMLRLKENKSYSFDKGEVLCDQHLVEISQRQTKDEQKTSSDKDRIEENSIEKNNICHEVIDYLNQVLGTRYTTKNKTTISNINARISEGHSFEDFKNVIDKKFAQWHNDPKMSGYLRPETLFCSKHFESYLNEIIDVKPETKNDKIHNYEERQYDYAELEKLALGGK